MSESYKSQSKIDIRTLRRMKPCDIIALAVSAKNGNENLLKEEIVLRIWRIDVEKTRVRRCETHVHSTCANNPN
ncbi:hypothetical protein C5167_016525 [Papaver somniferum]|nr:hypothetical protein C5167_016525 [Papaver somniferum]